MQQKYRLYFVFSPQSHKSQWRQINSSLQKKIHHKAIDFINCSGNGRTGFWFYELESRTKFQSCMPFNYKNFSCLEEETPDVSRTCFLWIGYVATQQAIPGRWTKDYKRIPLSAFPAPPLLPLPIITAVQSFFDLSSCSCRGYLTIPFPHFQ